MMMAPRTTTVVFKAVKQYEPNRRDDFELWQTRVKDLLMQQGISAGLRETKPDKMEDDEWEETQEQAAATIRLCLSDEALRHVIGLRTPNEILDKLEKRFEPERKLRRLKMKEGSNLAEHVEAFRQMVTDLEREGGSIRDTASILLSSLPPSYSDMDVVRGLVMDISLSCRRVEFEDVIVSLLAAGEQRENNAVEVSQDDASLIEKVGITGEDKKEMDCYDCKELEYVRNGR